MKDLYTIIRWPDVQEYMDIDDFREHSYLAPDEPFGSSAYFVEVDWLNKVDKTSTRYLRRIPKVNSFSCVEEDEHYDVEKYRKKEEITGFCESEIWNLDATIAAFIASRLPYFISDTENMGLKPSGYKTCDEYLTDLTNLKEWCEKYSSNDYETTEEEDKQGLDLFVKLFPHLWT